MFFFYCHESELLQKIESGWVENFGCCCCCCFAPGSGTAKEEEKEEEEEEEKEENISMSLSILVSSFSSFSLYQLQAMSAPNPTPDELEARETELFRSGPLSVLTASVKSNSQVSLIFQAAASTAAFLLFEYLFSLLTLESDTCRSLPTGPDQPEEQSQAVSARQGKRNGEERGRSEIEERGKTKSPIAKRSFSSLLSKP